MRDMDQCDLYCAACDKPTDREVTETFPEENLPDITFAYCTECDPHTDK